MSNYDRNLDRAMREHPTTLWQFLARYLLHRLHVWSVHYADDDNRIGLWLAHWTDRRLYPKEN